MVPDIITKLRQELDAGITTEVQVVYLMAAIRKIIEQEGTGDQYQYLKFHADWALHSSLKGSFAQSIISSFNKAHLQFQTGVELVNLPMGLRSEIIAISGMDKLRNELSEFLDSHDLPNFSNNFLWLRFLPLYGKVIEDCPLNIRSDNTDFVVTKLTVRTEVSTQRPHNQIYFRIAWNIEDRDGHQAEFFIINSFSDTD